MNSEALQLANRLALTVPEAAKAVGVSDRHLRSLLPEIPHTYLGGRIVIPVKAFEEWLSEQTKIEKARADLGDMERPGANQRPAGMVVTPKPLIYKGHGGKK